MFVPLACFNVSPSELAGHPKLDGIVFTASFVRFPLAHGSIPKSYGPDSLVVVEVFWDELVCPNMSRVKWIKLLWYYLCMFPGVTNTYHFVDIF